MKISSEKPDIFPRLEEAFGVSWDSGIIITYDGVVYCKDGKISPDLVVHEQIHIEQQKRMSPEEWLEKYIHDKEFRLEMEREAYKAQADYLRKNIKDRNELSRRLHWIWSCMSRLYGEMITYQEAQRII